MDWTLREKDSGGVGWGDGEWGAVPWGGGSGSRWIKQTDQSSSWAIDSVTSTTWTKQEPD